MRNALVFAPLGLALGLVAYWLAAPGRDAPHVDAAVAEVVPQAASPPTVTPRAPSNEQVTRTTRPSTESFEESASLVPPLTAPETVESPGQFLDSPQPLDSPQQRIERLVAAGFGAERAAEIVQAVSQQRLSAAHAEYEGSGTLRAFNASAAGKAADALREKMGDADYERYLTAMGEPKRVVVGDVEPGSAAANAGLQAGDEIQTYDGRRVFSVRELNALMLEGAVAGQTVPATIVRDGQALQLYVSAGPLGMAARSAR